MSKAIRVLERVGGDARLRRASESELQDALARAEITPALQAAILRVDRRRLEALLGATANTCSLIEAYECDQDRPAGRRPLANPAEAPVLADAPAPAGARRKTLCATPARCASEPPTLTGEHLAAFVGGAAKAARAGVEQRHLASIRHAAELPRSFAWTAFPEAA